MDTFGERPLGDRLRINLPVAPVSQQATASVRGEFVARVRALTSKAGFLLSGDVHVEVQWLTSPEDRYETDRSPDVDNVLKPLLDAISGPEGVLIDDNQVQSVSCSWLDLDTDGGEQLFVEILHSPDEWIGKQGLVFVQLERGLCFPIPTRVADGVPVLMLNTFKKMLAFRDEAKQQGLPSSFRRAVMPLQRVFHRTRLGGFEVVSEDEFRARFQVDD